MKCTLHVDFTCTKLPFKHSSVPFTVRKAFECGLFTELQKQFKPECNSVGIIVSLFLPTGRSLLVHFAHDADFFKFQ
jgi:hypothetical protein